MSPVAASPEAARPASDPVDLKQSLTFLGVEARSEALAQLESYLALLAKWNQVYNLTAIRDPAKMVSHHLLDSAAIVPHLRAGTLLDVGSGAGLPGIPCAVLRTDLQVTVLDSNQKKTAFMRQAVAELGLPNAEVVCARVEDWHPARQFGQIVSRAYAELRDFVTGSEHLLAPGGRWLAMKGTRPDDEMQRLPAGIGVTEVIELQVPQLGAERHLVCLMRAPEHGGAKDDSTSTLSRSA